jgi:hypothetical protein
MHASPAVHVHIAARMHMLVIQNLGQAVLISTAQVAMCVLTVHYIIILWLAQNHAVHLLDPIAVACFCQMSVNALLEATVQPQIHSLLCVQQILIV